MKNLAILDAGTEVAISEYYGSTEELLEAIKGDKEVFVPVGEFDDDDNLIDTFELTRGVDY